MRQTLLFLCLFAWAATYAQGFKLAGVNFNFYPNTKMVEQPEDQEISTQTLGFFLNIPKKLKNNKTTLINGINYTLIDVRSYNSPLFEANNNQKKLHRFSLSSTAVHQLPKNWTLIGNLQPILASDFRDPLSAEDLLLQSLILLSKKLKNNWVLGGGVLYTPQSGEPKLWPAIQIKHLGKHHQLNALLPSKIDYMYSFGGRIPLSFGMRGSMGGALFNVSGNTFSTLIPEPVKNIINSRIHLGPILQCSISNHVHFECWGGMSLRRKFQLVDNTDTKHIYSAENGPFFGLGLVFVP